MTVYLVLLTAVGVGNESPGPPQRTVLTTPPRLPSSQLYLLRRPINKIALALVPLSLTKHYYTSLVIKQCTLISTGYLTPPPNFVNVQFCLLLAANQKRGIQMFLRLLWLE